MDILGDGALGAHGGSGLSALGGTIRVGELLPSTGAIAHALKLELWAHRWYFRHGDNRSSCFTWPATGCDSYAFDPELGYNGTNPFVRPGSLLAVPPAAAAALAPRLATAPGAKILRALTDFGGYLVDDTASAQNGAAFCAEPGVNAEVEAAFGYSIRIERPLSPQQGAPLFNDLVLIFQALSAVVNNGPDNVGGGGTPRRPPAPPICGAD